MEERRQIAQLEERVRLLETAVVGLTRNFDQMYEILKKEVDVTMGMEDVVGNLIATVDSLTAIIGIGGKDNA